MSSIQNYSQLGPLSPTSPQQIHTSNKLEDQDSDVLHLHILRHPPSGGSDPCNDLTYQQGQELPHKAPSVLASLKFAMTSWFKLLLIFIPVSWALYFLLKQDTKNRDTIIFTTSFIAIIPLAKLLALATDMLSDRLSETMAGIISATFGNVVELIVSIVALAKCELRIVQASLIGSILSNLVLVLGTCFLAGGWMYSEQCLGRIATQSNISLLALSAIVVTLPIAFYLSISASGDDVPEGAIILSLSRGSSIMLLLTYCAGIFFQLYTHRIQEEPAKSVPYDKRKGKGREEIRHADNLPERTDVENLQTKNDKKPDMNLSTIFGLLIVVTAFIAVTAEFMVGSIDGMTQAGGVSKEFVSIVLLPIAGNVAENVSAVTVAVHDKLTTSMSVAIGSSIQITLFVIPMVVTIAWMMGRPLTILFDPYETVTLFSSVLIVNYVVQDGKSNWLEGMVLMCLYVVLALTFWYYPGSDPSGTLAQCT